jgi:hypothetical protein
VDYANRGRKYYTSITSNCPGFTSRDEFCTFTIDVGDVARAAIGQSWGDISGVDREWFELAGCPTLLGGDALWEMGQ